MMMALAVLVAGSACTTSGLAFRTDERVKVLTPADREHVNLPVEITWRSTVALDEPDGPRGYAVFVDRQPMRPGQSLRAVADDVCRRTPGCPDLEYLRERDVYITQGTSLIVDNLADNRPANRTGARDAHEAVIVLIDETGHRVGEAAYNVEFFLDREDA
jgi:hypothetical protein